MATPKKPQHNGLIGFFLHTFEDGKVNWQSEIIAVDGDMVLVQLFSWIMGEPTLVKAIPRASIYSEFCQLYASAELMNQEYEKIERKNEALKRAA